MMDASCNNVGTMIDDEFFDKGSYQPSKGIVKDVKGLERYVGKPKNNAKKEVKPKTKDKTKKEIICPHCCDYNTFYIGEMINHLIVKHLTHWVGMIYDSSVSLTQSQYLIILVYYADLIIRSLDNYCEEKDYVCPVCGYLIYSGITHQYDPHHFWKSHLKSLVSRVDYSSDNMAGYDDYYANLIIELVKDSRVGSGCKQFVCPFCLSLQCADSKFKKHLKDMYFKAGLTVNKNKERYKTNYKKDINVLENILKISYNNSNVGPDSGSMMNNEFNDNRSLVCHQSKYVTKKTNKSKSNIGKSKKKVKKEIICPRCCDYSTFDVRAMINHLTETHLMHTVKMIYGSSVTLTQSQYFIILVYYADLIILSFDNYYKEKDYVCPVCGYLMYSGITHDHDRQHFWKSHLESLIGHIDYSSDNEGDCDDFHANLITELVKDSRIGSGFKKFVCPFCLKQNFHDSTLKKHLKDKYIKAGLNVNKTKGRHQKRDKKNLNILANTVPQICREGNVRPDTRTICYDSNFSISKILDSGLEVCQHCTYVCKSMKILRKHVRKTHSDNLAVNNWLLKMGLKSLYNQNEISNKSLVLKDESLNVLVASRSLVMGPHSSVNFHLCIHCNYTALSVKMLKKHVQRNHIVTAVSMPSLPEQQSEETTQFDVEPIDDVGAMSQYSGDNSPPIGPDSNSSSLVTDSNLLIRRYNTPLKASKTSMRQTYKVKDTKQNCLQCANPLLSESDLKKHTLSEHKAQKRCCNQLRHLIIHLNQKITKGKIVHRFNYITEFSDFKGQKMSINKEEISQCTKCNYRCKNSFNLKAHMILEHTSKKHFICRSCGYKALTSFNMIKHVSATHKKRTRPYKKLRTYHLNLMLDLTDKTKKNDANFPNETRDRKALLMKKYPVFLSQYLSFL